MPNRWTPCKRCGKTLLGYSICQECGTDNGESNG
jgi:ribosomal protein L32